MPIFNRTDPYCEAQSPGGHPFFYVGVVGISLIYFLPLIYLWWNSPRYLHVKLKSISFTWRSYPARAMVWVACISVISIWPYCLQNSPGHLVFLVLVSAFIMLAAAFNGATFEHVEGLMWPETHGGPEMQDLNGTSEMEKFIGSEKQKAGEKEPRSHVVSSYLRKLIPGEKGGARGAGQQVYDERRDVMDPTARFFDFVDNGVNKTEKKLHGVFAAVVFLLILVASTLSIGLDFGAGNVEYAMGVLLLAAMYLECAIMVGSTFVRLGWMNFVHERWNTSTSDMERLFVFTAFVFVAIIPNDPVLLS